MQTSVSVAISLDCNQVTLCLQMEQFITIITRADEMSIESCWLCRHLNAKWFLWRKKLLMEFMRY